MWCQWTLNRHAPVWRWAGWPRTCAAPGRSWAPWWICDRDPTPPGAWWAFPSAQRSSQTDPELSCWRGCTSSALCCTAPVYGTTVGEERKKRLINNLWVNQTRLYFLGEMNLCPEPCIFFKCFIFFCWVNSTQWDTCFRKCYACLKILKTQLILYYYLTVFIFALTQHLVVI